MFTEIEIAELGQKKGYIYSQETFGTVDGPGVRYVLFLQGCPLRCVYCHNPDSIPTTGGKEMTAKEVTDEILRYRGYTKRGGVTFSGGEPLLQAEFLVATSKLLKKHDIHIAIDTSGILGIKNSVVKEGINISDLIILDVKGGTDEISIKVCGADNQRTFETLDYCENVSKPVWIRHVILRDYTLNIDALKSLALKLKNYKCIERVELLPFHKLGEPKWETVNMRYLLRDIDATNKEELEIAAKIFSDMGLNVVI